MSRFSIRRVHRVALAGLLLLAVSTGAIYGCYRWQYPYGHSHCCDKQLYMALHEYARAHDGVFPRGGATPEASLGLLYGGIEWDPCYLLCGKTGSEDEVRRILASGGPLTPEACNWHYVEGLTLNDSHKLAIFWDKEGLGHAGERLSDGGHIVMFVQGDSAHVPASQWPAFLAEQQQLYAQRKLANPVQAAAEAKAPGQ